MSYPHLYYGDSQATPVPVPVPVRKRVWLARLILTFKSCISIVDAAPIEMQDWVIIGGRGLASCVISTLQVTCNVEMTQLSASHQYQLLHTRIIYSFTSAIRARGARVRVRIIPARPSVNARGGRRQTYRVGGVSSPSVHYMYKIKRV